MTNAVADALAEAVGAGLADFDGLDDVLGLAEPLADALALGVGLALVPFASTTAAPQASRGSPLVTGWSVTPCCAPGGGYSTLRKASRAGATSFLSSSELVPPATLTTSRLLPSVTTSGSETPLAFTRLAMIDRAWSRLSPGGAFWSGVTAVSVRLEPPARSMPSFGCGFLVPVKNTSA